MLPSPVSFTKRRLFHRNATPSHRKLNLLDVLLSRARVTNLGLLVLASLAVVSLLCNLFYLLPTSKDQYHGHSSGLISTIAHSASTHGLTHLIVVPGHAIWKGVDPELRLREDQWILEPYQRGVGRVSAFFAHILRGAELAREDEHSLLIFSGGQTRPTSTTTEAESYMRLAVVANVFQTSTPFIRATTEDHALDSFQNLLFSIARFHEYTGRYPTRITVVGYEFKRARFTDLHRAALRWPLDSFRYIGVDPNTEHSMAAEQGERENGFLPYTMDMYGCHSFLLSKRRQRNRYVRFHSYYTSSPRLRNLFDWCPRELDEGGMLLYQGDLPWDQR
ncbi:Uncharacterized protein C57A10.07 [Hypsizygus marmoreus]|uniref:Uncharacterized protein C57A10.07 n=1 Tax=Hypsizygus marmoreus TaxID=39966 RepID=A0A369JSQ0_HYPMA|nr:Uncharacterized protein C57A10.07 [Hypsizygus marmoreus]